ncbi:DUF3885 domain-containing protein [Vagococcus carniphilus]|uniref:DUF3885 domain-containing protein n=1 Tax=Vagococcus carniphilus TaxID=218144 RepID=A0AAW8U6P1_9ENTE|nr:DUF3885 domain-containing protein [Vagococcus carniphilus]MDT2835168.1 DUF3885 domain-containing protein [Vagococcus carniphilus]
MNKELRNIYLTHHHTYKLKENIRFELAYGNEKKYYSKIEKGKIRANILFEEVFKDSKIVQMIFIISQYSSKNKVDKFLYRNNFKVVDSFVTKSWDRYYDGETNILVIETEKSNLRVPKIIDGICYEDFYRNGKLRIKSPIIFYNKQDNLILNIYDDRGCDIWSDNLKRQKEIYNKYNSWILDYDREIITKFYESVI